MLKPFCRALLCRRLTSDDALVPSGIPAKPNLDPRFFPVGPLTATWPVTERRPAVAADHVLAAPQCLIVSEGRISPAAV
jgi:hypothetical protein